MPSKMEIIGMLHFEYKRFQIERQREHDYNGCFIGTPGLRGYLGGVAATFSTMTR